MYPHEGYCRELEEATKYYQEKRQKLIKFLDGYPTSTRTS